MNRKTVYILATVIAVIIAVSSVFLLDKTSYSAHASVVATDGSATANGTGNTLTLSLTTSSGPDIIYVSIVSRETVSSVSASGLTWTRRASVTFSSRYLETWYAVKSTGGTTSITISFSGNNYGKAAVAFGITGANTTSPFDVTTPASSTGSSTSAYTTLTTSSANDFIIGALGTEGNPSLTVNSTMLLVATSVSGSYRETSAEYKVVSQTLNSARVGYTLSSSENWGMVADAIKQATTAITFTASGLGSDTGSATIFTIDGTSYTASALPKTFNWHSGTTHSVAASTPISATTAGKRYTWSSWTNGGGLSSASGTYTVPNSGTTVTATYGIQYQLTVTSDHGSPTGSNWYNAGASATFSVTTPDGSSGTRYILSSWTGTGTGSYSGPDASHTVTMNNAITETANWITQYQLTVNSDHGSPSGANWYPSGASATFSVTTPDGTSGTRYVFSSWTGTGTGSYTGSDASRTVTMNNAITETASWTTQYELIVSGGDGTGAGWYNSGSQATSTASNTLNEVSGQSRINLYQKTADGATSALTRSNFGSASESFTMSAPHSITWNYKTQYYLGVTGGNNVAITVSSPTGNNWFDSATVLTVHSDWVWDVATETRTAIANYAVDEVNQNPERQFSGTLSTPNIDMSTYHSIVFQSAAQYAVHFEANPASGGSTSPAAETTWFDAGNEAPISANANPGYIFSSWSKTEGLTIADILSASTTATISNSGTITANFQLQVVETALNVTCTPQSASHGSTISISGKLTLKSDSSIGVGGEIVGVFYYKSGNWEFIGSAVTESDGSYIISDWAIPSDLPHGFHPVKATFTGDNNPYQSSSAVTTDDQGAGIFVVPEYLYGTICALTACFVALAVIKRKKIRDTN